MNMEVCFTSRKELALDVWEYYFETTTQMDFIPGQYAKFWFANDTSLGGRTFTLTSAPGATTASFIVRFPNPMSDYKQRLIAMKPGEIMKHEQPMGDAILPRETSTPLVFIAQGIGIASYIALLRECQEKNLPFKIDVFWTRRTSDALLKDCFEPFLTGFVTLHEFDSTSRLNQENVMPVMHEQTLTYLSGSQSFVEVIGTQLEDSSILRERMIYDYYEGYTTL